MPILSLLFLFLAEPFPRTASESLTGQQMTLPDSIQGHASVLIVGFSKSSQDSVKAWDIAARKQLGGACEVYSVAVLEDAPSFVRGMIKHSMKGSIPAGLQNHFLVVVKGEGELKKAAGFSQLDDPYVMLLDSSGKINWRNIAPIGGGSSDFSKTHRRGSHRRDAVIPLSRDRD